MRQADRTPNLGFRALQAVIDLRATFGRQSAGAFQGIVAHIPPADRRRGGDVAALSRLIVRRGGRLERAADAPMIDALCLAASQPEPNRPAFACATAILLADRLQGGAGHADLSEYWESFASAYCALALHDRVAILQGFRTAERLEAVRCDTTVPADAYLTCETEVVRTELLALARRERSALEGYPGVQGASGPAEHLHHRLAGAHDQPLTGDSALFDPLLAAASNADHAAMVPATALLLAEATRTGDAEGWFGVTLWTRMAPVWIVLRPPARRVILAGLRALYEADPNWRPLPELPMNAPTMGPPVVLPPPELHAAPCGARLSG